MTKAYKNNMAPGVPKRTGFSPKAPGVVAAKPPSQGKVPPYKPHSLMGSMNKTNMPR